MNEPGNDPVDFEAKPGAEAASPGLTPVPVEPALGADAAPEIASPAATQTVATPTRPRASLVFLTLVSVVSLVADLGTKIWAERALQQGDVPLPRTIIKGVFGFMLAKNKGGAWGLLQNHPEKIRKPFFVVVSVLAIVFIVSLYRRLHPNQRALRWGLPLVLGGALGNLADRIRYGHVIDFIDVQATWESLPHHWPTFNVADIAICVGVALMAVDMLSGHKKSVTHGAPVVAEPRAEEASPPGA